MNTAQIKLGKVTAFGRYWASRNDDHPQTYSYSGYCMEISVLGLIIKTGIKYRCNAKKGHNIISRVRLNTHKSWFCEKRDYTVEDFNALRKIAEDTALEAAQILERKGFNVNLTLTDGGLYCRQEDQTIWIDEVPAILRSQVGKITIEDLYSIRN